MNITWEVLDEFGACTTEIHRFIEDFPEGVNISPIWGTFEESNDFWNDLLTSRLRYYVGWAIEVGLIPRRIRANFRAADLRGACLDFADLRGVTFEDACLLRARLAGANLNGVNLMGADMRHTVLNNSNFHGAMLRGANLAGAVVIHANLLCADLREADLFRTLVVDVEWNAATLWPEGYTPPPSR